MMDCLTINTLVCRNTPIYIFIIIHIYIYEWICGIDVQVHVPRCHTMLDPHHLREDQKLLEHIFRNRQRGSFVELGAAVTW